MTHEKTQLEEQLIRSIKKQAETSIAYKAAAEALEAAVENRDAAQDAAQDAFKAYCDELEKAKEAEND